MTAPEIMIAAGCVICAAAAPMAAMFGARREAARWRRLCIAESQRALRLACELAATEAMLARRRAEDLRVAATLAPKRGEIVRFPVTRWDGLR